MGSFTCELKQVESPKAVANFIGLAEGSRTWIDPATGAVRSGIPYYDGLTFHRVISGFMNQSGSRNGLGTDGPGYQFRDEVTNGLTHSGPGILSMANSGKHTNGAQFFITAVATPHLDGLHTVFGQVTTGQDVIDEINAVPTGANDKPLTPVVIQSVSIRRVGEEEEAFDIHAQGLPVCKELPGRLSVAGAGAEAGFQLGEPSAPGSVLLAFRSTDLIAWSRLPSVYQAPGSPAPMAITLESGAGDRGFFHLSETNYSDAIGPDNTIGHDLTASWSVHTIRFQIDGTGKGGTGVYSRAPGESFVITNATLLEQGPYRTTWRIDTNQYRPFRVSAILDGKSGNTITGRHEIFQAGDFTWNSLGKGPITLIVP